MSGEGAGGHSFYFQRRNSAPCDTYASESPFGGVQGGVPVDEEILYEVRRYIDKQLDRVIHETLHSKLNEPPEILPSSQSKTRKGTPSSNKTRRSVNSGRSVGTRERERTNDVVEDLSLFSVDNVQTNQPLVEVPVLQLRNTSSEDSEENWRTRNSLTSQWNTRSSAVNSVSMSNSHNDRSDATSHILHHKSNPTLFSPIYESISVETQDEQSALSSPKLAFLTAQKVYYDPQSPPTADKLKLLKVKGENQQTSATAEIFKRKSRLCRTIYKVVSRSKSVTRLKRHEITANTPPDEPLKIKSVKKRKSRSSSSDEELIRGATRMSGDRMRVGENTSSNGHEASSNSGDTRKGRQTSGDGKEQTKLANNLGNAGSTQQVTMSIYVLQI